jgi:uncharacterized protein YebE (UPF0316 family)
MDDLVLAGVLYVTFFTFGMVFLVKDYFIAAYLCGIMTGIYGRILWCEYKKFMEK